MDEKIAYSFGGRLTEAFPSQVIVDLTERCNLSCPHCQHSVHSQQSTTPPKDIEVEIVKKMIDEVAAQGEDKPQYIRFTAAGEPLLHPHLFEILEYSARNSGVAVSLTTNGTLLGEKNIEKLLGCNLSLIDISIDAFKEESYAKIRKGGDLKSTRNNVLNLLQASAGETKIAVSMIAQPENAGESEDFIRFWREQGADHVFIRRLHSNGGADEKISAEIKSQDDYAARRACVYPWERIVIKVDGMLAYCPDDWCGRSNMVDYRTTTIRETWNSEFYQNLRKAHLSLDLDGYAFCENCPDWAIVRWPHEGRAYANMVEELTNKK